MSIDVPSVTFEPKGAIAPPCIGINPVRAEMLHKALPLPDKYHEILRALTTGFQADPGSRRRNRVNYCISYPMVGRKYQTGGIMVVGRAANGWPIPLTMDGGTAVPGDAVRCAQHCAELCQMDWAMARLAGESPCDGTGSYSLASSSFWQISRLLAQEFHADEAGDEWPLHLAWSNLYKVAPDKGGNPSTTEARRQDELEAAKLLRMEIDCLKPHLVVLMTGWDWFEPFAELLEVKKHSKEGVVVGVGIHDGSRLLVTTRPEGKIRGNFIKAVMEELADISCASGADSAEEGEEHCSGGTAGAAGQGLLGQVGNDGDQVDEFIRSQEMTENVLAEYKVGSSCAAFARKHPELANDARFTAIDVAFSFDIEDDEDGAGSAGEYYIPGHVRKPEDGEARAFPTASDLTVDMLAYWEEGAARPIHPVIRVRYADLVWEWKKRVTGESPAVTIAHAVVEATLDMVSRGMHAEPLEQLRRLDRALTLAARVRLSSHFENVVLAIMGLQKDVIDDHIGLWIQPFDLLLSRKLPALPSGVEEAVIQDLEERLLRYSGAGDKGHLNPPAAKEAAERLARYYQQKGKRDDQVRVLKAYGAAYLAITSEENPLVSCAWLQQLLLTYRSHGLRDDAAAISQRLKELESHVHRDMKEIRVSAEISEEEVEQAFGAVLAGTMTEALHQIALRYLPSPDDVKQQLREMAEVAPLPAIFPLSLLDECGRTTAVVGSLDQDLEGRLVHQTTQNMAIGDQFLAELVRRFKEEFSPSTEDLLGHLSQSPLFTDSRRAILHRGIEAFLSEDYIAAISIIIPEIEAALRELLVLNGGLVYKPGRHGGLKHRTLGDVLEDPVITKALTSRLVWYLNTLLCDARGWNLRNNVCHGILAQGMYSALAANRVFHALLLLGMVRTVGELETAGAEANPR
jgi:hypothetical protein